jgi:hypothetical protein
MAQSQLTVRTLALAMVALVLACVHAARGDGHGVASFTNSRVSGVSSRGSVVTVRGDPWHPGPDARSTASRGRPAPPGRQTAYRARRGAPAPHQDAICIVRHPGEHPQQMSAVELQKLAAARSIPLQPLPPGQYGPPAPIITAAPLAAAPSPIAPLARNAFYLSPVVGASMP